MRACTPTKLLHVCRIPDRPPKLAHVNFAHPFYLYLFSYASCATPRRDDGFPLQSGSYAAAKRAVNGEPERFVP
jgi:hypothetical protein